MLQISEKGKQVPASPIRKLVPFANKAKERGVKVYHLNIGQPDIETPHIAIEAMNKLKLDVIEYTASDGNKGLKVKMAQYYQKRGINITDENILVTTGGSEAILFAFMSTLNEGDEIIIPEPYYANYSAFATIAGAKVKTVTSSIENNFALPAISEIEKLITPRTKGIVIINPNNPTGYLYSQEEVEGLAQIVKKHNLYLYADEVYREYCYDGNKHFSVLDLKGVDENVILFESLSKTYSECGLRIGGIISRNQEVLKVAMRLCMARLCPPALGQIAAEASYDTPEAYFVECRKEYTERRDFMVKALNDMPGVVCPMPKGAFYAIVKLPVDDADKFAQWLLEEFEYNKQTVMVAPASGFYNTPGLGKNEVRIAYVLKTSELQKAMETLAVALQQYPGRQE
ncbi:pyridoxal phosphate-dependent aminotransferase [Porphyromonadaceae bacterium OttesenSCG-928-L07]|nr:pyridoxal phosphate-dependent aminotransferase [Porphyromonadaceae bacterium OttesenSCG-928-L07]MDL2330776.1 pyridoxal phosphate-dependent aminotransferase [Odoribacter sp. OttesenSCG-928-A06]